MKQILFLVIITVFSQQAFADNGSDQKILELQNRLSKMEGKLQNLESNNVSWLNPNLDIKIYAALDKNLIRDDSNDKPDNSQLKYAVIDFNKKISSETTDFKYVLSADFGQDQSNIWDMYVNISPKGQNFNFTIGQFKEPFSLAVLNPVIDDSFVARAAVTNFAPSRNTGLAFYKNYQNLLLAAGIFGDSVSETQDNDESLSLTSRASMSFHVKNDLVIHVGSGLRYSNPSDQQATYKFKEASYNDDYLDLTTGSISNLGNITQENLEFALIKPRWSLVSEYFFNQFERKSESNLTLGGGYLLVNLGLNGEINNYNETSKVITKIPEISNLWEAAYRYSIVDLNDSDFRQGEYHSQTIALNYYLNPNIKFIVNYITSKVNDSDGGDNIQTIAFRTQLAF